MKTKLFHLVCLLTVMAFAVSCGKDASTSSGNGYRFSNGVLAPGAQNNTAALQRLEALRKWANNNVHVNNNNRHLVRFRAFSKGTFSGGSNQQQENCTTFLGMQFCANFGSDYSGGGVLPDNGTLVSTCVGVTGQNSNILITKTAASITDCTNIEVSSGTQYTANSNTELLKALSLNNNNWVIYDIVQSGSFYYLYLGPNTFGGVPSQIYLIDTSVHPVYNPIGSQQQSTIHKIHRVIY